MKNVTFLLAVLAVLGGIFAFRTPASGQTDAHAAPNYGFTIPPEYRDWRFISLAHEEGNLHSFAAVLGNDVAVKAYREGTLPFPDGTIIATLHYSHVSSDENNKVFGREQSFVPGAPTNIQFMFKNAKAYAATGGWGFAQFKDGKPDPGAALNTCFPCHSQVKARDLIFARYAR